MLQRKLERRPPHKHSQQVVYCRNSATVVCTVHYYQLNMAVYGIELGAGDASTILLQRTCDRQAPVEPCCVFGMGQAAVS